MTRTPPARSATTCARAHVQYPDADPRPGGPARSSAVSGNQGPGGACLRPGNLRAAQHPRTRPRPTRAVTRHRHRSNAVQLAPRMIALFWTAGAGASSSGNRGGGPWVHLTREATAPAAQGSKAMTVTPGAASEAGFSRARDSSVTSRRKPPSAISSSSPVRRPSLTRPPRAGRDRPATASPSGAGRCRGATDALGVVAGGGAVHARSHSVRRTFPLEVVVIVGHEAEPLVPGCGGRAVGGGHGCPHGQPAQAETACQRTGRVEVRGPVSRYWT